MRFGERVGIVFIEPLKPFLKLSFLRPQLMALVVYVFSLRNHGMGDTSIKFEVVPGKNQKSEYVMACGKHTVRGWCKDCLPPPCHPTAISLDHWGGCTLPCGLSGSPEPLGLSLRPLLWHHSQAPALCADHPQSSVSTVISYRPLFESRSV